MDQFFPPDAPARGPAQSPELSPQRPPSALGDMLERFMFEADGAVDAILQEGLSFGTETAEMDEAIQFDGDFAEFKNMLLDELRAVRGDREKLDRSLKLWREYFDLTPGPQPYPNAPNFTVPLIRSKVNGFTANIRSALDKQPFFAADALTHDATRTKPAWEATMEREVNLSDAVRQFFMAVQEAGVVGTGVLRAGVATLGPERVTKVSVVPLEDFFVSPPTCETLAEASAFMRFPEPAHVFMKKVREGVYDRDAAEIAFGDVGSRKPFSRREGENHSDQSATLGHRSENLPLELWECWYRWGGVIWRVVMHLESEQILRVTRSPLREAIGEMPPFVALRPLPNPRYFYGDSYAMILAGVQGVVDWGMNSILGYNQTAITPGAVVDEQSVTEVKGSKHPFVYPGAVRKVRGVPNDVIKFWQPPPPVNAERLMEMAQSMGNDATFFDYQLNGTPIGTVRSATEHSIMQNAAQVKLSEVLKNLNYDFSDLAEMLWGLIVEFKVKDEGIYQVFEGEGDQFLLAEEEIPSEEIEQSFLEFGVQSGHLSPDAYALAQQPGMMQQIGLPPLDLFIAGARRGDIRWKPQGGETIPDKVARSNKFERLMQYLPVFEAAQMLPAAWHVAHGYLLANDIMNWRDFLPAEPPDASELDATMRLQIMAQISGQLQGMRQGGGGQF